MTSITDAEVIISSSNLSFLNHTNIFYISDSNHSRTKNFKPSIGLARFLIKRCSCSAILFRYTLLLLRTELPKKKSKKNPLTKNDKKNNRRLAGERVVNENVIGMLKRFKIIADKYRNRRKRFGLRFNLLSDIYNFELR